MHIPKLLFLTCLIGLFFLPVELQANSYLSLAVRLMSPPGRAPIFGHELVGQFGFANPAWALRIIHDSYDQLLFGEINRWGLAVVATCLEGDFKLLTGAGFSLASTPPAGWQSSLDIYLRAKYWLFFGEGESLFYSNGYFSKLRLGLEYPISLSPTQQLVPYFGVGATLNSDYSGVMSYTTFTWGISYAF